MLVIFAIHQIEGKVARACRETRAMLFQRECHQNGKDSHSPLATGKSCDIYESVNCSDKASVRTSGEYKPAVVEHPLLGTSLGSFLLLLLFNLRCL